MREFGGGLYEFIHEPGFMRAALVLRDALDAPSARSGDEGATLKPALRVLVLLIGPERTAQPHMAIAA